MDPPKGELFSAEPDGARDELRVGRHSALESNSGEATQ